MSRFIVSAAALLVLLLATVSVLAEDSGGRPASTSNLDGEEELAGPEASDPTSAWAFKRGPATVRVATQGSIEIVVKPLHPCPCGGTEQN